MGAATRSEALIAVVVVVVVVAAAALGAAVWAATSNGKHSAAAATTGAVHPANLTHAQYLRLYAAGVIGKTTTRVLSEWPIPYETYKDTAHERCDEWFEHPPRVGTNGELFNFCFKNGILELKDES